MIKFQRRTDHTDDQEAQLDRRKSTINRFSGQRCASGGHLPQARHLGYHLLQDKSRYGGMTVSDVKRLKSLQEENAKLKRLLADAMLDNAALKDLGTKNF